MTSSVGPVPLWRVRVLNAVLWITAGLAVVAFVPGAWVAWREGLTWLIVVDVAAWVTVMALAAFPQLGYRFRAAAFLVLWFAFAWVLLLAAGMAGSGIAWILVPPVLAGLFFGRVGAAIGSGCVAVTMTFAGVAVTAGWSGVGALALWSPPEFLSAAGTVVFLAAMLSLSVATLVQGVERAHAAEAEARRRLQEQVVERVRLEERLLEGRQLEALGSFAAGIAHDFNNLLVPILAVSDAMHEEALHGSPQRRQLATVVRSAERARDLVARILAYGRAEGSEPSDVELDRVLEEIGPLITSGLPEPVTVRLEPDAPGAWLHADPGDLQRIVMNLTSNGVRAMADRGGLLTVRSRRHEEDTVVIEVHDQGRGMSASVRQRAFDPFFTTGEPGQGAGLGLGIVQRLVARNDGTIEIDSEVGVGTRVTVVFPVRSVGSDRSAARHDASAA
ncbi:MAG: ATP-binding protein [Trueperaceae bacterium]